MTPAANPTCPLCGAANGCAPAASGTFDGPCWCRDVVVDPAVIAGLPVSERGKACLCRRCATANGTVPAPTVKPAND
ncbi:cysteine-rich CWC family protein [Hydrocarboniphaga sp.]|uniref:cysteine-rich CWC family protein n=1 Tax=Hydrocarboniphaga sp. TaxID=2033016 RepID=UPI00262F9E41|nr:cysteine-rich CWC family protein [Hydrocarboniphaga sp.]